MASLALPAAAALARRVGFSTVAKLSVAQHVGVPALLFSV